MRGSQKAPKPSSSSDLFSGDSDKPYLKFEFDILSSRFEQYTEEEKKKVNELTQNAEMTHAKKVQLQEALVQGEEEIAALRELLTEQKQTINALKVKYVKQQIKLIESKKASLWASDIDQVQAEKEQEVALFKLLNYTYKTEEPFSLPNQNVTEENTTLRLLQYRIRNTVLRDSLNEWLNEQKPNAQSGASKALRSSGESILSGILPYTQSKSGFCFFQAQMVAFMVDMMPPEQKAIFSKLYETFWDLYADALERNIDPEKNRSRVSLSVGGLPAKASCKFNLDLSSYYDHSFVRTLTGIDIPGLSISLDPKKDKNLLIQIENMTLEDLEPKGQIISKVAKASLDKYQTHIKDDLKGLDGALKNFYSALAAETAKKQDFYNGTIIVPVPEEAGSVSRLAAFLNKAQANIAKKNNQLEHLSFEGQDEKDSRILKVHLNNMTAEAAAPRGELLMEVLKLKHIERAQSQNIVKT